MVNMLSLWLPILVATALVFVASSVIHMVLGYHRRDFKGAPDEDGLLDALRGLDIPPGDYAFPHVGSREAMGSEEVREKWSRGPVGLMTLLPPRDPSDMGTQLIQWFVFCLVVSAFTAYATGLALGPGSGYMEAFRMSSTVAFGAYALAHLPRSIWYAQSWATTARNVFDGLVYGLLTGGAFGWLWPT